jgi:uracil-DNA glycosylase
MIVAAEFSVDELLEALRRAQIGSTHNQFRGAGGERRLANVAAYLEQRAAARVLAVGEAGGYQGARWSGIAFTSERDLLRWGAPFQLTSDRPQGWSEPSGTIVHRVLDELGAERDVVLWNTVPTHPHAPGKPLSNRRPTAVEIGEGSLYLRRVLDIVRPRLVLAVGRVPQAALATLGVDAVPLRHPSHGGATLFAEGMRAALA